VVAAARGRLDPGPVLAPYFRVSSSSVSPTSNTTAITMICSCLGNGRVQGEHAEDLDIE